MERYLLSLEQEFFKSSSNFIIISRLGVPSFGRGKPVFGSAALQRREKAEKKLNDFAK